MLRILKPGGVLYVGVPNEDCFFNVIKHIIFKIQGKGVSEKIDPIRPPYHINGFSPKSVQSVFTRAGFVIDNLSLLSGIREHIKFRLNERAFWISLCASGGHAGPALWTREADRRLYGSGAKASFAYGGVGNAILYW